MSNIKEILHRVETYAESAGTTPDAVCRIATGNPRLYKRLKRRVEYEKKVFPLIEAHMEKNPAPDADVS